MDERVRFIAACMNKGANLAEICRQFGISRKTGYRWLARYNALGPEGLYDRKSVPRQCPHRTAPELIDALVKTRKEHPSWGPKKLRAFLCAQAPQTAWPAPSTIGAWLKQNGLIRPRRRRVRAPERHGVLDACLSPNSVWATDFKGHFALGSALPTRCHPLTITDVYSRYLLKCEALSEPKTEPVRRHFERAFREYGLPRKIRSDNGPPFASLAPGGLSALSVWWIKLGIVPERIEPGQPQQNGRHERMHRTLKQEATQPAADSFVEQQRIFDRFRQEYNEVRPHEALGQRPPAQHYDVSPRPFPATLTVPEYPNLETRWLNNSGFLRWRGRSLLIARCVANEPIGLRQIGGSEWEVFYGPIWLGILDERNTELQLHRQRRSKPDQDSGTQEAGPQSAQTQAVDTRARSVIAECQTLNPEVPDSDAQVVG